jgi:hypothetical protein
MERASKANHDIPKGPVIEINNPFPGDPPLVNAKLVGMMEMVIDQGGEEIG